MTNDLIINGVDMAAHGIEMGKGFINALKASLSFKDDIENESAIASGKQMLLSIYYAPRDISLTFNVFAKGNNTLMANDDYLLSILYGRKLTIKVKGDPNYYRLVYMGKSVSYNHSSHAVTRVAKFCEVNPDDRGSSPINPLFTV